MKIVVNGVGKVGGALVENLIKEKHDVIVIDKSQVAVDNMVNKYDVKGYVGGGLDKDVFLGIGVDDIDCYIAATSKDEVNILSCLLAKKIGVKKTVARVRDPEYYNAVEGLKDFIDLDFAFNPEHRTAMEIVKVLNYPSAKNIETFGDGRATMITLKIKSDNPVIGKSLMQITSEYGTGVLFLTVERKDKTYIPHGDFVIEEGDEVNIISSEDKISEFLKAIKLYKPSAKSVFIVGGGKITFYLAEELMKKGIAVKILEHDTERCSDLASKLTKVIVINGDGSDQEVLQEESLSSFDALVTLTGIDEENVITSLYAQSKNISKVITKLDRPSVLSMAEHLGLDTVVSPRDAISNSVIRFVRTCSADSVQKINTLCRVGNKTEVLEFTVGDDFSGVNVPLKHLKFKSNVLVGGIVRDGEFIVPNGNAELNPKDKVIVVVESRQIAKLEQVLR